jgi:DNA-binding IclR family transcriptional regulator
MSNGGSEGRTSDGRLASQVQSVDRALLILDLLARHGDLGVTELAGHIGVHKSTAFRLLAVLERHRLVEQLGERGKYRLGFGVVRLAGATTARLDLVREGRETCRRLATELGETINIAVLDTGAAMNISQEQGGGAVTAQNWIGKRTPLHATSSGKVLLAWAADDVVDVVLDGGLAPLTPLTITDAGALRAELDRVRLRGWSSTCSELEIGLNAIAAPIRDVDSSVVGAVSASGPVYRLAEESFPETALAVAAAAREISRRIGFVDGPGSA